MRRFFTEPQNISSETAYIYEDSKHIEKVLRMELGDEIILFDGTGYEYYAKLKKIEINCCIAEIFDKRFSQSEPDVKISLFQGIPKSGKMETIIQKSVELGVYEIFPVIMDRCVVKLSSSAACEKVKRWNKVSLEAVKQCGRGIVPKVHMPVSFEEAVCALGTLDLPLMPYELLGHSGECGLKNALESVKDAKSYGLLVGPEGGFSDSEALYAAEKKIKTIGLGKRILRTETVASALIPVIMFYNGEF